METIQVKIEPDSVATLKISWSQTGKGEYEAYLIDRNLLINQSEIVRDHLQKIVNFGIGGGDLRKCGLLLRGLAQRGHALYRALFIGVSPMYAAVAQEVKQWLENDMNNGSHQLIVIVGLRVHIPWGLMYSSDADNLEEGEQNVGPDLYRDFWCLKYSPLVTLYSKMVPIGSNWPMPAQQFCVLPVVHQSAWDAAVGGLVDQDEQSLFGRYFRSMWKPLNNKKDFLDAWKKDGNKIGLLYFYCHANGTSLAINNSDMITTDDFKLFLTRDKVSRERPPCFVFLNGCHTALGDPKGGFLEATGGQGFCGFIGTEVKIPDVFALKFSLAFFLEFFDNGLPLHEVMSKLREEHWPLSAVFNVSCPVGLHVTPIEREEAKVKYPKENISFHKLGTNQLNRSC